MGNVKSSIQTALQKNVRKKTKKTGISQYLDNGDDSSDDEFKDDNMDGDGSDDPSKLCDLELINLLKFCNELKNKHKETDDHQEEVMLKSIEIGKKEKEKTLILDMDETLIAAKFEGKLPKNFQSSFVFPFQDSSIHVRFRPYLHDTLEKLGEIFEIIVFTAGVKEYADPILDKIDPDGKLFKKRLYRDHCIKVDQFFIKDLDIILDRKKTDMVIVDNSILSFAFDLANGVPINSFMGDEPDDRELLYMVAFLQEAFYQSDIREACE
jgi:Dullard-like phosphatase family protein